MIPCLGVLVLNRGDLLRRLIDSIDFPVQKLCIVQNGNDDTVSQVMQEIENGLNPLIQAVYLNKPFRNMGVAPSWNTIIKSFPECPYWLISNNDTLFLPGDLEKYHVLTSENPSMVVAAPNGAFSCFTITPEIIAKVGLFDENIWPIYSEDVDYFIRMKRAGVERTSLPSELGKSNDGSWTIRSNGTYQSYNNQTQAQNAQYVRDKWGTDNGHSAPWNHPSRDVKDWWYDPYRRRAHSEIWQNFEHTSNRMR